MNKLKKGQELKLPGFLIDLYYDLRDRHLLPVAIVLVLAMIVVPIALTQSSSSEGSEAGVSGAEAGPAMASNAPEGSGELVAKSAPGLRKYQRRLDHLRVEDPFEQHYTQEASSDAPTVSNEESTAQYSEPVTEPVPANESEPAAAPPPIAPEGETDTESNPGPSDLVYYSYAIDVAVTAAGSKGGASSSAERQPEVRHNLPELTMLPSRKSPALIYMGASRDGKKALMLVSSNVKSLFGDAKCVLGSQTCELLAMEPGLPETILYGGEGKTFKVEIRKIHLVETDKLNRAPLGKTKKHSAERVAANSRLQPK